MFATTRTQYPPPPDLTSHITRIGDQYSAGGGFGDVYKCLYHGSSGSKEVAVKAFRFGFTVEGHSDNRCTNMLRRELGIWRRLDHDNIVPFLGIAYGFGMSSSLSLVSLWMPNESLQKFLVMHDDKLDVQHRLQLLLDVANGLKYLHSFPIVHGDLNCNNVLLDADYTARLADFGYSSLVGNIPAALMYLQRSTSRPGALRWVAPEQIVLEGTFTRTVRSDIYSFGCVGLQVLSGKQPWSEVGEDAAVVLHLFKGHKPQRPESRKMDDSHWSLIQDCWSPMTSRPTAEVIVFTIHHFLRDCPSPQPLRQIFMSRDVISRPLEHVEQFEPHGRANPSPRTPTRTAQSSPYIQHSGHTDVAHPNHDLDELFGGNFIGDQSAVAHTNDTKPSSAFQGTVSSQPANSIARSLSTPNSCKWGPFSRTLSQPGASPSPPSGSDMARDSATHTLGHAKESGFHNHANPWASTAQSSPYTQHNRRTDVLHQNHDLDELFGGGYVGDQDPVDFNTFHSRSVSPVAHAGGVKPSSTSQKSLSSSPANTTMRLPSASNFRKWGLFSSAPSSPGESPPSGSESTLIADTDPWLCLNRSELAQCIAAEGPSPFTDLSPRKTVDMSEEEIIPYQGSKRPRTESSDNIEVLKAWKSITQSPHFKDVDIDELCIEFSKRARCDGTKVVLELESAQQLLERFE